MIEGNEIALGDALPLEQQAAPAELDQFAAQFVAQRPEFLVADEAGSVMRFQNSGGSFRSPSHARRSQKRVLSPGAGRKPPRDCPSRSLPPEAPHGAFHPAEQMNAVGDMADGTFSTGTGWIKGVPHVRLTWPCSSLTPLAARESFSASTVMQNGSCRVSGFTGPAPSTARG
jgi:hypothetical protein